MKKTICQQLKIKEFPFEIKDSNGNRIYCEDSDGFWYKQEFDLNYNEIYYEDSNGDWWKREYDSNGNRIYCENSDGFWFKTKYDSNSKEIYHETSYGNIFDERKVELTLDEIAEKFNIDVKKLKIKK